LRAAITDTVTTLWMTRRGPVSSDRTSTTRPCTAMLASVTTVAKSAGRRTVADAEEDTKSVRTMQNAK
jgi:hypothetical protein